MGGAAAQIDPAAVPREWLDGLARLAALRAPGPLQAQALADARLAWAGGWIATAAADGWSCLDLFGAHRGAPRARLSCMGLICMLAGRPILSLSEGVALIEWRDATRWGVNRFHRDGAFGGRAYEQRDAAPIWELRAS